MFLGNAHIVEAIGECLAETGNAGSVTHCSGDDRHGSIFLRHGNERIAHRAGVGKAVERAGIAFHFIRRNAMELIGLLLRRLIAVTLMRDCVQKKRDLQMLGAIEILDHAAQIVPVNGTKIRKAQRFKELALYKQILYGVLEGVNRVMQSIADERNARRLF